MKPSLWSKQAKKQANRSIKKRNNNFVSNFKNDICYCKNVLDRFVLIATAFNVIEGRTNRRTLLISRQKKVVDLKMSAISVKRYHQTIPPKQSKEQTHNNKTK